MTIIRSMTTLPGHRLRALLIIILAIPSMSAGTSPLASDTDRCALDGRFGNTECVIRDLANGTWIPDPSDGPGNLHHRARRYADWLHRSMLPAGGVMRTLFSDAGLDEPVAYDAKRDSAIWTGAYLAAEALRLMETGSADAAARVKETVRVLDRWWRISGDPGYLARFAAPEESPQVILDVLTPEDPDDIEVQMNTSFDGTLWRWRSQTSRDQYQGVLFGLSLAYEATDDVRVRALIRENVVAFAEQLQREQHRDVDIVINGSELSDIDIRFQHTIFIDDETSDGDPVLTIDLGDEEVAGLGMLVFWPNPSEYIRQIPGFWWVPDVVAPTQAIQLAATFRIALQVTEGIPDWEARHQALRNHYDSHVEEWLDFAADWEHDNQCGDAYFGINIGFMPLFIWARLETDPVLRWRIQRDILRDRFWRNVQDHKNVFFAFLYAAQAPDGEPLDNLIDHHVEQLAQFPQAPNLALPRDLSSRYPEDSSCPGLSTVAIDVGDRVPTSFVWERHPWKLQDAGTPNLVHPGVDFLLAYWLGRQSGFIDEDAPGTATRWRTLPPPTQVAGAARQLVVPSVTPTADAEGATVRVLYLPIDPANESLEVLGIRMHWDSFALELRSITDMLPQGLQPIGTSRTDALDLDGNPSTDRYVELSWVGDGSNWPGPGTTPALLFRADFGFTAGFDATTSIGFSADTPAPGYLFSPWRTVIDKDGLFMRQVQRMYVGYYGRPGDPLGVAYWADRLRQANGNWTSAIVSAFGDSAEYLQRFGDLSQGALIDNLYQQMFNRAVDPLGRAFYLDLLNGTNDSDLNPALRWSTLAQIAIDIASGAQNEDLVTLDNKLDVAAYFTVLVEENDRRYMSEDIPEATAILSRVDEMPSTLVWQMLETDELIAAEAVEAD